MTYDSKTNYDGVPIVAQLVKNPTSIPEDTGSIPGLGLGLGLGLRIHVATSCGVESHLCGCGVESHLCGCGVGQQL